MLDRYFQEELDYLRRSGDDFSQAFPKLTKYLSTRSTDPDVERLIEGFAFLSARLREKIDDQLPEVSETLLNLFWPGFLRSIPSATILRLDTPKGAINERQTVREGMEVESISVGNTICRFRTAYDVDIFPLVVEDVRHESSRASSRVTLRIRTQNGEPLNAIDLKNLRFYLGGSEYSALTLNLYLQRYMSEMRLRNPSNGQSVKLDAQSLVQSGMRADEELLPYPRNGFIGYRLIQEYFALPQKFHFLELCDLPIDALLADASEMEIIFDLNRPIPPDVRVLKESFQLNCVPALNLFEHDADPLLLDGKRSEYKIIPSRVTGGEFDIFEITEVKGWLPDPTNANGITHHYDRFESFLHEVERVGHRHKIYDRDKLRQSLAGHRVDHYLTFLREDELFAIKKGETISIRLICSNGRVPTSLGIGEICMATNSTPSFVMPTNITRPSQPLYPILLLDLNNVLLDLYNILLDLHNVLIDLHNVLLDDCNVLLDLHNVLLDLHNVLLDLHNVLIGLHNVLLDPLNALLDLQNVLLDSHNVLLELYNVLLDLHNILLDLHNILLDSNNALLDLHNVFLDFHKLLLYLHNVLLDSHNVLLDLYNVLLDLHNVLLDLHNVLLDSNHFHHCHH